MGRGGELVPAETRRLLDFARAARVDGGFAWLDDDGRPDEGQPLQLWITGRMTHVFALGELLGVPDCAAYVDHGLAAIEGTFEDREHGGWFGEVGETAKEAYPHAFVLLAASSACMAGRPGARELLDRACGVVLERFWSEDDGAAAEAFERDWSAPEPYRGANANMHLVEAFLAVGDATGDPAWAARGLRIADRLVNGVAREHGWRLVEHFDADWRPLPDYNEDEPAHPFRPYGVTPGHGFEWARLLLQLRLAVPDPPGWLEEAARGLFDRAWADGWAEPGGFVYTTDFEGEPVVRERLHWVACEALLAAAALGDDERRRMAWDFAAEHLIDRERGSWHHELGEDLRPVAVTWNGKPDVYHAVQATLLPELPLAASAAGAARQA